MMKFNKEILILIGVLVVGILLIGGWWIWNNQNNSTKRIKCINVYFEMSVGDEVGPPRDAKEQKRLCENRLNDFIQVMTSKEIRKENIWYDEWQRYKDFDFTRCDCKFIRASSIEERKTGNFVYRYEWTCYFNCCTQKTKVIDDEKYCEKDTDCHWMCGCGCINKNAKCETPEGIMYDCYPGMEEKYSCVCKDNQCETIEK